VTDGNDVDRAARGGDRRGRRRRRRPHVAGQRTDPEAVELVEHVLGSHLERFGTRDELVVTWGGGHEVP
jgi:hypothetical protein